MIRIMVDMAEQDSEIPSGDPKACDRDDCPGKLTNPYDETRESYWSDGYGLAGGGMGAYTSCTVCEKIICKNQDQFE